MTGKKEKMRNTNTNKERKFEITHLPRLTDLLNERNLDEMPWKNKKISLNDPIEKHSAWIYNNLHKVPFLNSEKRSMHGIQHANRAAIWAIVLTNLYRLIKDVEALELTVDDMQLIQIAVLLHDSARMNEDGEDLWDFDSGVLVYYYLAEVLGVDKETAICLGKAVAEKDAKGTKNIYQKIIHDADCLDIIRVRSHFDARYLDFYQQICKQTDFEKYLAIQGKLIEEVRSVCEVQGDTYRANLTSTKELFESEDGYARSKRTIFMEPEELKKHSDHKYENKYPDYECEDKYPDHESEDKYSNNKYAGNLAPVDPRRFYTVISALCEFHNLDQLSTIDFRISERERIAFRGISIPSAIRMKKRKEEETLAGIEFRKAFRTPGVYSGTSKKDGLTKNGNPNRSVSINGVTFADSGFYGPVIIEDIIKIDFFNSDTRFGKKKNVYPVLSNEEKKKQLHSMEMNAKMGGSSYEKPGVFYARNNETLTRIHKGNIKCFFYTLDPCFNNFETSRQYHPLHRFIPPLKAIFIRNEYKKIMKEDLPIIEYSGYHNYAIPRNFTEAETITMWVEICSDYLHKLLGENCDEEVVKMTLEEL